MEPVDLFWTPKAIFRASSGPDQPYKPNRGSLDGRFKDSFLRNMCCDIDVKGGMTLNLYCHIFHALSTTCVLLV